MPTVCRRAKRGQTLTEYGLLLGLVAAVLIAVLLLLGPAIAANFDTAGAGMRGPGGPAGGGGPSGGSDFELTAEILDEQVNGENKELYVAMRTDTAAAAPYIATITLPDGSVLGTVELVDEGEQWGFPNGYASGTTTWPGVAAPCSSIVGGSYLTVTAEGSDGSSASTNVAFLDCDTAPAAAALSISEIVANPDDTWTIAFDAEALGGDSAVTGPFDFVFLDYALQPLSPITSPTRTLSSTLTLPGNPSDPSDCSMVEWVYLEIRNADGSEFATTQAQAPCPAGGAGDAGEPSVSLDTYTMTAAAGGQYVFDFAASVANLDGSMVVNFRLVEATTGELWLNQGGLDQTPQWSTTWYSPCDYRPSGTTWQAIAEIADPSFSTTYAQDTGDLVTCP